MKFVIAVLPIVMLERKHKNHWMRVNSADWEELVWDVSVVKVDLKYLSKATHNTKDASIEKGLEFEE